MAGRDGRIGFVKQLADGNVPKWAVMARAVEVRNGGVELKSPKG